MKNIINLEESFFVIKIKASIKIIKAVEVLIAFINKLNSDI